jgi:hypothetical protein
MEPESSLPHSQVSTTYPYPEHEWIIRYKYLCRLCHRLYRLSILACFISSFNIWGYAFWKFIGLLRWGIGQSQGINIHGNTWTYTSDPSGIRNNDSNFKVIYVRAWIRIHIIKPTNALMLKLYFLHTICHNSDMFRCILIIFRELQNISKAYIMFRNSLKIIKMDRKMSELWQIVRKKHNFNISAFVGFIVWNITMFEG